MYQDVSGVYQKVSSISKSIRYIKCIYQLYQVYQQKVLSVSRGIMCIRYIKCILVTRAFVTFYLLMCGLDFIFAIFANNKVCVLWI